VTNRKRCYGESADNFLLTYVFNDDVAAGEAVYRRIRWGNDYNVKRKGLARKLAWHVSRNSIDVHV
jgi:hypothetical protein